MIRTFSRPLSLLLAVALWAAFAPPPARAQAAQTRVVDQARDASDDPLGGGITFVPTRKSAHPPAGPAVASPRSSETLDPAFERSGAGLTGISSGTGGVINTGSTTVGADSGSDGVGRVSLHSRGVERRSVDGDGAAHVPGELYVVGRQIKSSRVFDVTAGPTPAAGDGAADDTAAINLRIDALNAAGGGVLYLPFPSGYYRVTGALNPITKPFVVRGDGASSLPATSFAAPNAHLGFGTVIKSASPTATLFTVTAAYGRFENIALENVAARPPTAGAGVRCAASVSWQRCDFDSVTVDGFYDNVRQEAGGGAWSIRNSNILSPVRYGVYVSNAVNADSGDWSISDSNFWALTRPGVAGVWQEGSGGGKITNCKFNGNGANMLDYGVSVRPAATSIVLVSNTSFENFRLIGAVVYGIDLVGLSNVQCGAYTPGSYCVYLGNLSTAALSGLVLRGVSVGIAGVVLENARRVTAAAVTQDGFGGTFQTIGSFGGELLPGESTAGPLAVTANTVTPHFQLSRVGAGLIKTITVPQAGRSQTACFIPEGAFTWDATGNIAAGGAGVAAVGRTVCFSYSAAAGKWYASY